MDAHRNDDSFAILGTAGFDVDMRSLGATSICLVIAQVQMSTTISITVAQSRNQQASSTSPTGIPVASITA